MEDLFDLLAEGVIEETDNSNLKSIVAEEAIIKIEALSEGVLTKLSVKIVTGKERQEKMISGKPIKGTNQTYDIIDVNREIECVEHYLKTGKKNLTDEQAANLKAYLPKLKARFSKLGGKKALDKAKSEESAKGRKKIVKYAAAKAVGLI